MFTIEIKYVSNIKPDWTKTLNHDKLCTALGVSNKDIVYNGETHGYQGVTYINTYDFTVNIVNS